VQSKAGRWDSGEISGSFLHLIIFLVGRFRRPRPSAGIPKERGQDANGWAFTLKLDNFQLAEMLIAKNIMGMPQGFYIITIAEKAEVAATIAAVLSHPIAETPKPVFVPVSISSITHRRLFQDGYAFGFHFTESLLPLQVELLLKKARPQEIFIGLFFQTL